ncbi:Adiponectin receptor protein 2 [Anabarilius grahami]|uniref:Adiponectin receptor protein 2 n=1 Tax=Anabarilius grahami TaxID=495550 RepID=A0A3N0Z216_ANAGA|nr:Adiponectin receptor protein 2 [Anabarilius grahami]
MGRGSPIPPMLRRKIVEQYQKGVSQRKIAKRLKLSSFTVHNIIQRFRESGTISVRKGQGRKTILDARDLRALRRHCITYRNATVMEITTWAQEYFQKTLSVNTIHRAIRRCRLKLYRSKKKPYLNMIQKRRRFLWAKAHLKWTVAKWKTVLWSDESKFEVLFGKLGRHVIRTKEDNPRCYQRSVQKPASLMVLSCMSACGMGSLHIWKGTISAERYIQMWEGRWRVIPHDVLPDWLKDNDFLLHGHRPPMPSFRACFKSIFRIHTETGNIWTHLLGCLFFLCLGIVYMFRPNMSFVAPFQEKIVIGMFFLGAILCLSFSWLFHTVYCHSEGVSRVFSKLDYSGIAFLIMGSFVPWLYYSFYCSPQPCFIYLIVVCILGIAAITVSQCDFFATPQYRGVRAGVFVGLGLSGVVPTLHFMITEGFLRATTMGQMGWLFLMAVLYITGACLYAARIPERFFPGKCDIWFHSHQLFHILVVAGAFVHFHGVSNLQEFRYTAGGGCAEEGAV